MASTPPSESTARRSGLRPVPEVVDWIVGALLVLVGVAGALGGAALLAAIDRSEIREMVANEEIQSDVLGDPELVDVTQAVATWTGVGLIATGAILFVVGVAYVLLRHRTHQRAAAGEAVSSYGANALLGAITAIVLSFVPFSQVLGGIVAGYLEAGSTRRDVGVGALSGFLSAAPFLAVAVFVVGGAVAGLLGAGEGGLALAAVAILLLTLAFTAGIVAGLGAIGGFVGGKLADRGGRSDRAETTA